MLITNPKKYHEDYKQKGYKCVYQHVYKHVYKHAYKLVQKHFKFSVLKRDFKSLN